MITKDIINDVINGALVHDIGKLIQRADGFDKNHSQKGFDYIKNLDNLNTVNILDCVKYHHANELKNANLADNSIAYIVYEADNIASGSERRKDFENLEECKNKFAAFDKETVLKSVFNVLNTNEKGQTKNGYYLKTLAESQEANMPVNLTEEKIKAPNNNYKELKKHLDSNLKSIAKSNSLSNSLVQLLESLTSFIPSSTNLKETADISLFDHSKLTAAIASSMYLYFKDNNINDLKEQCFNQNKINEYRKLKYFMLVSAGIVTRHEL